MTNINNNYLNKNVKEQMQLYFVDNAFISLADFFNENLTQLKDSVSQSKNKENYKPLEFRKKEIKLKENYDVEILKYYEFFKSNEFVEFVQEITELELELQNIELNIYSHKDFIIISDKQEKKDNLNVIFDISDKWNEEFGGVLTYTTKEEEVFYLKPTFNSLTILYKPEEVMRYMKYINNKSKNRQIIRFEMEFEIK